VRAVPAERTVRVKKRCCKSDPRCKRCPVVMKRLEKAGRADRIGKRTYLARAKKKHVRAARDR
jgi:hypothetical protein